MYTKEELQEIFKQDMVGYYKTAYVISFVLDLSMLGNVSDKYHKLSTFELENSGLLTLLNTADDRPMEYHMKIKNLTELKHAVTNLDEWDDDWN